MASVVYSKSLFGAMIFMVAIVGASSIYANLSFAVTDELAYKYFPPFRKYINANRVQHLGSEYYNIATSIVAGEGFANPFLNSQTGPTAWMPPVLPCILAALLWLFNGNRAAVAAVVVILQVCVLIGTGMLILILVRQTTTRIWALAAASLFVVWLLADFRQWFQLTHDGWIILLAIDLLTVGVCWYRPLNAWKHAAVWGLFGGLFAMINPILGVCWVIFSMALMVKERERARFCVALVFATLALAPWTVRNYLIFGRLIPVKSNLAYELYQSQCVQKDGLLQDWVGHPQDGGGPEGSEYRAVGEMPYLDRKRELFLQAVWADPKGFADRVAFRLLGATLWYVPFNRNEEARRPWVVWPYRLIYPLPLLSVIVLVVAAQFRPLHWAQWAVMGIYLLYLMPYVAVSFYERYATPLVGVKCLLVLWAADQLLSILFGARKQPEHTLKSAAQERPSHSI
ncbi:MAG TPA: hypothetical protein VE988_30835 [Gemmataceae bacterium]|nr:hypothetical protein [Gemmataceae bacterium]